MNKNGGDDSFLWLFVGSGRIANAMARKMPATGRHRLLYVYSRNRESAYKLANKNGGEAIAALSEEVMSMVDGIYVATPHSSHCEIARQCMNMSAKAVFIEKPFGVNSSEVKDLFIMGKENNVILLEAMCMLYNPLIKQVREEIGNPSEIVKIEIKHMLPIVQILRLPRLTDRKYAGGALLEIGIYAISLLSYLFESLPSNINIEAEMCGGVDMKERINLNYKNAVCQVDVAINAFCGIPTAKIYTRDKQIVIYSYSKPSKIKIWTNCSVREYKENSDQYVNEFDTFADIVRRKNNDFMEQMNNYTILTAQTLDLCRKKIGLIYPNDM